jgi:hypothetical protein
MLGAREPRRLSIDPASVSVCRGLLMLGSRHHFIPETEREVEALSGWEVVRRVEVIVLRRRR